MRTTLNLSDELITRAIRETGVTEKTKLIHMALEELVAKKGRERLTRFFGADKNASIAPRSRYENPD